MVVCLYLVPMCSLLLFFVSIAQRIYHLLCCIYVHICTCVLGSGATTTAVDEVANRMLASEVLEAIQIFPSTP